MMTWNMLNARIYLYYVEWVQVVTRNISAIFSRKDGAFPGFTWEVNGPIISLEYDSHTFPYPPGELKATIGISEDVQKIV